MVTVRAPNPTFNGERVGVRFRDGAARVEALSGRQRQGLRRLGYRVEDGGRPNDLSDLTVAELRAEAERLGIDLTGLSRKVDIRTAIETSS